MIAQDRPAVQAVRWVRGREHRRADLPRAAGRIYPVPPGGSTPYSGAMLRGLVLDFVGVLAGPGSDPEAFASVIDRVRRRGVRTAILSNDPGGPGADPLRELGGGRFVDAVLLSGDIGVAKPDARSFSAAANRLGLDVGECVFVDDQVANVRGAVAAGMVGVHHDEPVAAIGELAVLFGIDTVGPGGACAGREPGDDGDDVGVDEGDTGT